MLFKEVDGLIVTVPIQVKSVQFGFQKKGSQLIPKQSRSIGGLLKKHVEKHHNLSLFVYRPDNKEMWLFTGSQSIRNAYNSQSRRHHLTKTYESLDLNDNVALIFDLEGNREFRRWRIPKMRSAMWISKRIDKEFNSFWSIHDEIRSLSN